MQKLPKEKQEELDIAVGCILSYHKVKIHFVILFGSYARGDWVEDIYVEDGITYSYRSDFDLLVIIDNCSLRDQQKIERDLNYLLDEDKNSIPVSLIVHDIKTINNHLSKRQYFFADIKRQGIKLYDSGAHKLARLRKLSDRDRYQCAVEDFDYWFNSANRFFENFSFNFEKKYHSEAAFNLHQVTERLYHTIILVYTHYKPKTHDLKVLRRLVNSLDNRLLKVFPLVTQNDKYLFELLRRSYIDARYNKSFSINQEELTKLSSQVLNLKDLTKKLCEEKINLFKAKIV